MIIVLIWLIIVFTLVSPIVIPFFSSVKDKEFEKGYNYSNESQYEPHFGGCVDPIVRIDYCFFVKIERG